MREKLTNLLRAGYPGVYIVSPEEKRVESEIKAVTDELKYSLYAWSAVTGLVNTENGQDMGGQDPLEAVMAINELPESSVVLLRDFHMFLRESDPDPVLVRALRDALVVAKNSGKMLVFTGCRYSLPPELERDVVTIDYALPDKNMLSKVLEGICESAGICLPGNDDVDRVVEAASGLTTFEAENAFALSIVEAGRVLANIVSREKAATIKKSGILEVCSVADDLDSIGGLDSLKDWLLKRRDAFGRDAIDYGLPAPKGLLIIGIPGTGKSLTAKATANVFGRPLLRLDPGRIFGGLVGQSEANLRSALKTAEAIAPCVLWIDEIEKGFSGNTGVSDSGTSSRVFGSFLSWMQEKQSPVFVVATANDVSRLPPEFLRKGRFDELFFVDLPNQDEREAVWDIQVRKYKRDPESFDLEKLAELSKGFTGAEIEQVFVDSLYAGFAMNHEPSDLTICGVLDKTIPLSRLMPERLKNIRDWAEGRARMAS